MHGTYNVKVLIHFYLVMKRSVTFVRALVAKAAECKEIKIPMPSLKDHDIPQNAEYVVVSVEGELSV
jgi:hypothetical protein